MNSNTRNKHQGFSLIELMVVVAILGLLASIVMPAYQENVRTARRTDAMIILAQIMQAQERFFVNNITYTTALTDLGFASNTVTSEAGFYQISAQACGGGINECVNLVATAQGDQVEDGDLTINSQGLRTGNWETN
ncbi:MAG: type IV pilin protein [Candidatus Pelagadaptatus aseana]